MPTNLDDVPDTDLINELTKRGAIIQCGYCYPAACTNTTATELVHEHGYEYGPWQLIEMNHPRLAEPPQWPLYAHVPPTFRP